MGEKDQAGGSGMFWVWPRAMAVGLLVGGGVALGDAASQLWPVGHWGPVAGGAAAALAAALWDGWRGARVLQWIRTRPDEPAPQTLGLWGEMALRVERAVRLRNQSIQREMDRLASFLGAIEASPNGVILIDAQEQILWSNRTAADHLGLDPQRDRMQRVTNLVRAPAFVQRLHGPAGNLPASAGDEPVLIPDRSGKGLLLVTFRRYGEGQRLILTQDVTERERAETMRRDFVANVSHEIRTPLTVVSGFVETLLTLDLSAPERQRVLGMMGQQTRRMQALVDDLLTLAKLEGKPRPPADHWLGLSGLVEAVAEEARGLSAGRHAIEVVGAEDWEVSGNGSELQSALANLANNAVRYTPAEGRITLRVLPREDGGLTLAVQDTGPGIAAQHLPRLTERFYRVDGSRSRETGGTGLGLSIVKHVALRHGAELRIESVMGQGSTFMLVWPAARSRAFTVTS